MIGLAANPLPRCALGFGNGSLDLVSSESTAALWGVTTALDGRERTDDSVALTDASPLGYPTYKLSEREFDVTHSLDRILLFGHAGFVLAQWKFMWSLDGVGG